MKKALLVLLLVCLFPATAHAEEADTSTPASRAVFGVGAGLFLLSWLPAVGFAALGTLFQDWGASPTDPFGHSLYGDASYTLKRGSYVLALPGFGPVTYLATNGQLVHSSTDRAMFITDNVVQLAGIAMMIGGSIPIGKSTKLAIVPTVGGGGSRDAKGASALLTF